MASTAAAYSSHAPVEPNGGDITPYSTPLFLPSSRRTNSSVSSSPSFSSNSSSARSLTFPRDDSPFSPTTTLTRFSGIPFSWEQIPGIPKNEVSKKKDLSSIGLLPLPPAGSCSLNSFRKHNREDMIISPKKYYSASESFRTDPFFAALVECSKDDHHHDRYGISRFFKGSKVSSKTTLSDRFGFINTYASCKRNCGVSESIVYLPRSRPYKLLNRR